MIRCEEGHFYDPAKHSGCPWCAKPLDLDGPPDAAGGKTRPLREEPGTVPMPASRAGNPAVAIPARAANPSPNVNPDRGVTRRLDSQPTGIAPIVGWLVSIDGPEKGRDYRLHSEKNFIGRASSMDVAITGDDSVSRDRHAVVTFEPKKRSFWLHPGDASGLVYLNDEMITTPVQMKVDDVIEIGKTKLVLVPFVSSKAIF